MIRAALRDSTVASAPTAPITKLAPITRGTVSGSLRKMTPATIDATGSNAQRASRPLH